MYESSSLELSTFFVSSDTNENNDNDSYNSDLPSVDTQTEFSHFSEFSTTYDSVTIIPDTESYYSLVIDGTTQTVASISDSSSNLETNSEASFVSCDDNSYDSVLLDKGTQPKSPYLPESSTDFDSITITPDTKLDYSSVFVGTTKSLSSSFTSNYNSDDSTLSVFTVSSEDTNSADEETQPAFSTSAESDSVNDYVTVTPNTISYDSSVPGKSTQSASSVIRSTPTVESAKLTPDNQNEVNQPLSTTFQENNSVYESTTMGFGKTSLTSGLESTDSSTVDEFMQPSLSSTLYSPISTTVSWFIKKNLLIYLTIQFYRYLNHFHQKLSKELLLNLP